jgi:DNA-binding response OmpR family regulator
MNKKNILVVDDRDFDRKLIVSAFHEKSDFNFIECTNAQECLDIINNQKVDLILMDIVMPGTYGSDVLPTIRSKYSAIDLPIIMVTIKDSHQEIVNCLKKGANDYITKPVQFDVAISRVKTHLYLAELSRISKRKQEVYAAKALVNTYNHEINNCLSIAIACFKKDLSKDPKSIEILKKSVERISEFVKKTEKAIADSDWEVDPTADIKQILKFK